MSTQDNPTGNPELDDAQLTSPGGEAAAVSPDTLTLAELNSLLGKEFPDKDTALKSLRDTQSYVGKKIEDIEAEVIARITGTPPAPTAPITPPKDPVMDSELKEIKNRLFYSENPQFKGHEALISSMGADPAAVVETDAFKQTFEKLKVADEVTQRASVVHSSPRLAQTKSVTDEAVVRANSAGRTVDDVASILAAGINQELADNQ